MTAEQVLLKSARTGSTFEALKALESGADVHFNDDEALYSASWRGRTAVVQLLLEHGAHAASRGSAGAIEAAGFGHREIVEMLVKNGASDDALCILELAEQGFNIGGKAVPALLVSARLGRLRETKVLFKYSRKDFDRKTILQAIDLAKNGDHQEVAALLSEYPDRDNENEFKKWVNLAKSLTRNHHRIFKELKMTLVESARKCGFDDEVASEHIGISKQTFVIWKKKFTPAHAP